MHDKIWESTLLDRMTSVRPVNLLLNAPRPSGYANFRRRYISLEEISVSEYPEYIYFCYRDTPEREKSLPDVFIGELGVIIVSEAMKSVLSRYNLGKTRFHEVTLFEFDQITPRPGRWHMLHILENRETLIPEASIGLQPPIMGETLDLERTHFNFDSNEGDILAVDPMPVQELDMWMDRRVVGRIFFSNGLREAICASNLRTKLLGLRPCKVVD